MADGVIIGRAIVAGNAEGEALVTSDALSFWGGYDFHTGLITDRHHPLVGVCAAGRILAVPFSKGSSTTTAVLLEAVRAGTAPAAILITGVDSFFALASIVADVMYGKSFPVVALAAADFATLRTGTYLKVDRSGAVTVHTASSRSIAPR
jgi:predicted aconitase with swiveling domain